MPHRTCVACRSAAPKSDLVRFVERQGELVADPEGVLTGRGAYLCRSERCVEAACKKRGVFSRALRTKVDPPDSAQLLSIVRQV